MGYYINNEFLDKLNSKILFGISILTFIITCFIQYWAYVNNLYYNVWYDFVTLFICTICIFELFTRIKNCKNENKFIKITNYISKISLAIFFMHEIFLNLLVEWTEKLEFKNPAETLILFLLAFTLSVIFIFITSKNKFIKEKVFLIKG